MKVLFYKCNCSMLVTLGVSGIGGPIPGDEENQESDIILGILRNGRNNILIKDFRTCQESRGRSKAHNRVSILHKEGVPGRHIEPWLFFK